MNKKEVLDAMSQEFQKSLQDIDVTNGDVIKAMFPKSKTVQLTNMTIAVWYEVIGDCGKWVNYQIDWWNAKYKAESEEK